LVQELVDYAIEMVAGWTFLARIVGRIKEITAITAQHTTVIGRIVDHVSLRTSLTAAGRYIVELV